MAELNDGTRIGPLEKGNNPFAEQEQKILCSPLSIITKSTEIIKQDQSKSTKVKQRLIHDLSWPQTSSKGKTSVNSQIQELDCPMSSFSDAIDIIRSVGKAHLASETQSPATVFMYKVDITAAYRSISVRPQDWPLLGCTGPDGKVYIDIKLPLVSAQAVQSFALTQTPLCESFNTNLT